MTAASGVITLTGHVGSFAEKHAAEAAAGRVKGVKAVVEEIEVKLGFDVKRTDDEIAAAAVESLMWDVSVPKDKVQVKVEKGWVTLSGEVDWHFQKEAAELSSRRLIGVVGVINQITIKANSDPSDIHTKIVTALNRSWYDADKITVTTQGGKVRLDGSVRNWYERRWAETAAWGAPGVTNVENDLSII